MGIGSVADGRWTNGRYARSGAWALPRRNEMRHASRDVADPVTDDIAVGVLPILSPVLDRDSFLQVTRCFVTVHVSGNGTDNNLASSVGDRQDMRMESLPSKH